MSIPENIYIWGGGLIGYTLAQAFADQHKSITILDVDGSLIENINQGDLPRPELNELMASPSTHHKNYITGRHVDDFEPPNGPAIHFLSVPTEKNGETLFGPIRDAISKIALKSDKNFPIFLIAESTLSPNWFADIHDSFQTQGWTHAVNYHVGASPRRDVFNSTDLRMQHISKIIGGDSEAIVALMKDIYKDIAGDVHVARDAKHAMLVKIVENFLRDSALNIVNGLASVFPDYDMVDVFELAATKWNIERYHPSLGVGGYCIPLAKKYMADAADAVDKLEKILPSNFKGQYLMQTLESVIKERGANSVAVLGLSYGPSFKVHTHSPTLDIVNRLRPVVGKISVHDPFYTADEIEKLTNCNSLENLEALANYEVVILVTPHPYYLNKKAEILGIIEGTKALLIDNLGAFKDRVATNANYWEVGSLVPGKALKTSAMSGK